MIVAPATPSLSSLYGAPPRLGATLVLGISQSGRSPDVVSVLTDARRAGALTAAVTNDPASELADASDVVIELGAGPELAVAATKTYLAEIAVVAMLSAALSAHATEDGHDDGHDDGTRQLAAVPAAMRAALEQEPVVRRLAAKRAAIRECVVLARGFQYATAREWALKLKELTGVLADPYSGADFQHGPIALVGPEFPVLAVATRGPALDGMAELLRRLRDRGAELLVLSDDSEMLDIAPGRGVPLPALPEWLSPLAAIIPAQLFAYHLALARGLDPDSPRNLSKVTRTV
jgi:glucosamine--fructose-6-phosphate aminotransferase (isomerizing)